MGRALGCSQHTSLLIAVRYTDLDIVPELTFVFIGTSMILAKISDIVGRKLVLLTCLGSFTLFSALCGAAQTMGQLIMFRWCQGVGGGGVFALVQLMFMELVPRRKLPKYMSMVTSALALSLVFGPLIGGGITQHGSWRWIFLLK